MLRRAFRILAFPLAVLATFGLLYAVWLALDLPPEATMAQAAKDYLERYGLVIVLISAYLEGLLVIGWYFPGTLVIVLALIFAAPHPSRFALTAAVAGTGLLSAFVTNSSPANTAGIACCWPSDCASRSTMRRSASPNMV